MISVQSKRPRDVNAFQAAAILYGDWGTSKAYVIGLAFAHAGYSSFWLIAAVSVLMVLVGFNYISICNSSFVSRALQRNDEANRQRFSSAHNVVECVCK